MRMDQIKTKLFNTDKKLRHNNRQIRNDYKILHTCMDFEDLQQI